MNSKAGGSVSGSWSLQYVLIADIVGFSEGADLDEQARAATFLLEQLLQLRPLFGARKATVYPKGDGVILYVADDHAAGPAARVPLDVARALLQRAAAASLHFRASINWSDTDRTISLPELAESAMPIGDGINLADRLLEFAEPQEIVVTARYRARLNQAGLLLPGQFKAYRGLFVKNAGPIDLYSYVPSAEEEWLHRPRPEHSDLKRYAHFPPLLAETLERFREVNLEKDLGDLCDLSYDSVASVNTRKMLLSWESVYSVLARVRSDLEDHTLVVSPCSPTSNFWSSEESKDYLSFLERKPRSRGFSQQRVFIYVRGWEPDQSVDPTALDTLKRLHDGTQTLRQANLNYVSSSELMDFPFGVTLFPKLGCAVAPLPPPTTHDEFVDVTRDGLRQLLRRFSVNARMHTRVSTDEVPRGRVEDNSFRALILVDPSVVSGLVECFHELYHGAEVLT